MANKKEKENYESLASRKPSIVDAAYKVQNATNDNILQHLLYALSKKFLPGHSRHSIALMVIPKNMLAHYIQMGYVTFMQGQDQFNGQGVNINDGSLSDKLKGAWGMEGIFAYDPDTREIYHSGLYLQPAIPTTLMGIIDAGTRTKAMKDFSKSYQIPFIKRNGVLSIIESGDEKVLPKSKPAEKTQTTYPATNLALSYTQ